MTKKIFIYTRKIHQILALPMIFLIIASKLGTGTTVGQSLTPLLGITMIALAVTGGYMWFWSYFQKQIRQKNVREVN